MLRHSLIRAKYLSAEADFVFLKNVISYCTSFKAMFSKQNLPNLINVFVEFTPFSLVGKYLIFVSIKRYQTTDTYSKKIVVFIVTNLKTWNLKPILFTGFNSVHGPRHGSDQRIMLPNWKYLTKCLFLITRTHVLQCDRLEALLM